MAYPGITSPMGLEWCKILGISPENIKAITFRLAYSDLATVEVTRIALNTELQAVKDVIERYEFKAIPKVTA